MEGRLLAMGVRVKKDGERDDNTGVSFVWVPASPSLPLQELLYTTDSAHIDVLLDTILPPCFRLQPGETVDPLLIQKQADEAREAGCSSGLCPHVSPLTLQRAAEEGTLDRMQISTCNDSGCKIYMYLDESANYKQRPVNPRAVHYLEAARQNDAAVEVVYGDVFLAARTIRANESVSLGLHALEKEAWFVHRI